MKTIQFRVPQARLEESLLSMDGYQHRPDIWVMGVSDIPRYDTKELLYHNRLNPANETFTSPTPAGLVHVLVQTATGLNNRTRESFLNRIREMSVEAGLLFVLRRENMEVYYAFKSPEYAEASVILSVPGPCMEKLKLTSLDGDSRSDEKKNGRRRSRSNNGDSVEAGEEEWRMKHDRLATAIGMGDMERGFEVLTRARGRVVGVIGSGRAGSWLDLRLDQSGVGTDAGLILVDPDITGSENLDGMIVTHRAVGLPKAHAVGGTIAGITGNTKLVCMNASLSDPEVLDMVRMADFVFTATDESAVALATAVVAARHHIVHIDIRGGMAWTGRRQAVAGGELRVFIPGSRGCLGCMDRYNWQEALHLLGLTRKAELSRNA